MSVNPIAVARRRAATATADVSAKPLPLLAGGAEVDHVNPLWAASAAASAAAASRSSGSARDSGTWVAPGHLPPHPPRARDPGAAAGARLPTPRRRVLPLHLPAGRKEGGAASGASLASPDHAGGSSEAPDGGAAPHSATAAFASPAAGALVAQVKFARAMSARMARDSEGRGIIAGVGDSDSDADSDASSGGRQMVAPVSGAPSNVKVGCLQYRCSTTLRPATYTPHLLQSTVPRPRTVLVLSRSAVAGRATGLATHSRSTGPVATRSGQMFVQGQSSAHGSFDTESPLRNVTLSSSIESLRRPSEARRADGQATPPRTESLATSPLLSTDELEPRVYAATINPLRSAASVSGGAAGVAPAASAWPAAAPRPSAIAAAALMQAVFADSPQQLTQRKTQRAPPPSSPSPTQNALRRLVARRSVGGGDPTSAVDTYANPLLLGGVPASGPTPTPASLQVVSPQTSNPLHVAGVTSPGDPGIRSTPGQSPPAPPSQALQPKFSSSKRRPTIALAPPQTRAAVDSGGSLRHGGGRGGVIRLAPAYAPPGAAVTVSPSDVVTLDTAPRGVRAESPSRPSAASVEIAISDHAFVDSEPPASLRDSTHAVSAEGAVDALDGTSRRGFAAEHSHHAGDHAAPPQHASEPAHILFVETITANSRGNPPPSGDFMSTHAWREFETAPLQSPLRSINQREPLKSATTRGAPAVLAPPPAPLQAVQAPPLPQSARSQASSAVMRSLPPGRQRISSAAAAAALLAAVHGAHAGSPAGRSQPEGSKTQHRLEPRGS